MKKPWALPLVLIAAILAGGATRIVQDQCGPFTDVTPGFCPFILEIYYFGVTVGTSPTTFSPDDPLTRGQGAVFVAKGVNQSLARSSRRAALGQWWLTGASHWNLGLGLTRVGSTPGTPRSDGESVWVPNYDSTVSRVRASDGAVIGTWTGAEAGRSVLVAMGRVFISSDFTPTSGALFMIDPSQPPGPVTPVADLRPGPTALAFDGSRIWIACESGAVEIVTPNGPPPWTVTELTTGFTQPLGILFDGRNIWVTDEAANTLLKLDSDGAILQTVEVGVLPAFPTFDGSNIWVPNVASGSVSIVRASDGSIVGTISPINRPEAAAFDGERVLITQQAPDTIIPGQVSLFRASDLTFLTAWATVSPTPPDFNTPGGVCSDGVNFWVTFSDTGEIARF